jgi:hypothetical protein
VKLVVAHDLDGRVVKGRTADFKPACTSFHVTPANGPAVKLDAARLKAVFFVKTLDGDPDHEEQKDFALKNTPEKRVWVEFVDGEQLAGWSSSYASGAGFFFTPTDPRSNLERAYVYKKAVRRILAGAEADAAAAEYRPPRPRSGVGPPGS